MHKYTTLLIIYAYQQRIFAFVYALIGWQDPIAGGLWRVLDKARPACTGPQPAKLRPRFRKPPFTIDLITFGRITEAGAHCKPADYVRQRNLSKTHNLVVFLWQSTIYIVATANNICQFHIFTA
jgi:hypothetical protein